MLPAVLPIQNSVFQRGVHMNAPFEEEYERIKYILLVNQEILEETVTIHLEKIARWGVPLH